MICAASCSDEPQLPALPEVAFVTDRFEIAPDFDGELCAGNVLFMETRLAEIEALLGIHVESKIRFYWLEDTTGFCSKGGNCTADGTIYSDWNSFEHELVHAVAAAALGQRAKSFLAEGLAVAFASSGTLAPGRIAPSLLIDRTSYGPTTMETNELYGGAGHFVRFLYEEFGPDRLTELYRGSDPDDSEEAFRGQFAAVYGQSFDDVEALYLDVAFDAYPSVFGCPEPTMTWDGSIFAADVALACERPDVLRTGAAWMAQRSTLRLEASTFGELTVDGVRELSFSESCPAAPYDISDAPEPHGLFDAGWHTIQISIPLATPRTARVEFRPR